MAGVEDEGIRSASDWRMMLEDVAMRCDDLEGDMIRGLMDPLGWRLGKHTFGA